MKRITLFLVIAMCGWVHAQTQPTTGSITTASAGPGNCVSIRAQNNSAVGMIVSGVWSGTLTPNVQISTASGAPTIAKKVLPVDGTTAQSTVTANGGFVANIAGFTQFNVCATAWTSGSATVTLYATPAPNNSTIAAGGGGSGTVSANNGQTNVIATYAAAGGSTTVGPAASSNPSACMPGATSGEACFTPPAVAGTSSNPITVSNGLSLPNGTVVSPGLGFAAAGLGFVGTAQSVEVAIGSTGVAAFTNALGGLNEATGNCTGWSATSDPTAAADTTNCRLAAGVEEIGTGVGNSNGVLALAAIRAGGAAAGLSGTGACATFGTQTGGSNAGQSSCASATAASTLVITPGTTAPHGWNCNVQDQTTRANLFQQTANTTTTCTMTITSVTQNDVFVFTATQF